MRRVDWVLAAVVAAFLIGAVAIETAGGLIHHVVAATTHDFAPSDVSMRRLVSRLPAAPILPGEAR